MKLFLGSLVVAAAIACAAPWSAVAGPCSRDLPCVAHGAKPPWASECHKITHNSCWLYTPGWTCNPDGIANDQLIVDEDKCSEVFWNPDRLSKLKRHRWRSADAKRHSRHHVRHRAETADR